MTNPTTRRRSADELGYTTIRITKRAHRELIRRALADKRSIVAQLDVILGI